MKRKKRRTKPDWESVDWTRSSTDLAIEFGVDVAEVSRARRRLAPETLGKTRRVWATWFRDLDWSKRTSQLSRETGKSSCLVSLMRRAHAPHTLRPCRSHGPRRNQPAPETESDGLPG